MSANLVHKPRTWGTKSLTPFDLLRALGEMDLCAVARQDVHGQILGMDWDVVPEDGIETTPQVQKRIEAARAWVKMPDPLLRRDFRATVSSWLEEILITDALSLYPLKNRAGKFITEIGKAGLRQVDGATIYPFVDDLGQPPLPPGVAYQQIVHGFVETEFDLESMWYLPRNTRSDCPYGRSPTEMVGITINLGTRGMLSELAYYTDGNIPEGLYSIEGWDEERCSNFQADFDAELADPLVQRRILFIPKGEFTRTRNDSWSYDRFEWAARVVAWAYGVSPMPIAKVMNRATGEALETSVTESGVRPVAEFIASIFTRYLKDVLGFQDLRFRWSEDEVEDETTVYQRARSYYEVGGLSINEFLERTGGKPIEGEDGDLHPIQTAVGIQFLEDILAARKRGALPGVADTAAGTTSPASPASAAPNGTDGAPQNPSQATQGSPGDAGGDAPGQELVRWRSFALRRVREGRPLRKFAVKHLTPHLVAKVEAGLRRAGDSPERVRRVFDAARKGQFVEEPPDALRAPADAIAGAVAAWYQRVKERLTREALAALPATAKRSRGSLAKSLDDLELDAGSLYQDLAGALADSMKAGASMAATAAEIDFDTPSASALAYANKRAAELVGKRILEDGTLVDSPVPGVSITESLRDAVKEKVATAIKEGWSSEKLASELADGTFSPGRAMRIARTETGFAYTRGTIAVYKEAGHELLLILDGEGCLPDGHEDGASAGANRPGIVYANALADGQIWTPDQFETHLLGHPHCVRDAVPWQG